MLKTIAEIFWRCRLPRDSSAWGRCAAIGGHSGETRLRPPWTGDGRRIDLNGDHWRHCVDETRLRPPWTGDGRRIDLNGDHWRHCVDETRLRPPWTGDGRRIDLNGNHWRHRVDETRLRPPWTGDEWMTDLDDGNRVTAWNRSGFDINVYIYFSLELQTLTGWSIVWTWTNLFMLINPVF